MTAHFDVKAAIAQAAKEGPNMTESVGGDFERELPAAGLVRLRLIGYIELGQHEEEYKGEKKTREKVALIFELSGPKHPPIEVNGKKIPQTKTETLSLSLNEKATFFKLFKRLNHTGECTHFAELLGRDFLGTVIHVTKGEGADKKTYANLKDDSGFTIRPPYVDDPETGESRRVTVDEPLSPIKCFLWNFATKPMWDTLFIDGRWDDKKDKDGTVIKEGTSKNYWQNRIKSAANFKGSPIAEILFAGGTEPDLPNSEAPERSEENKQAGTEADAGAAADPLAGV
jgi:hypothetical protein